MKETFLAGRILLGSYFIFSGAHHFTNLRPMARMAAMEGVPMSQLAIIGAGVLLVVGGLSLLLGVAPKLGVAALVLFLVPVTLVMHRFWNAEGAARVAQTINFTKNVGLLGALLMLVAVPEPWPLSLGQRAIIARRHRLLPTGH